MNMTYNKKLIIIIIINLSLISYIAQILCAYMIKCALHLKSLLTDKIKTT